jgi:flagellar motor switch protein FliM
MERGLTPLETTVTRGVVDKMLVLFREAWQDHVAFAPDVTGFESTPEMLQIASHEDNVLVANLEVRAGEFTARVAMCIPLLVLETFLGEKSTSRAPVKQLGPTQRLAIESAVRGSRVEVVARFPTLRLSARDIAGLKVGQVVETTQPIDGLIELNLNGTRRFLGSLGQYRRMLGVKITDVMPADLAGNPARGSRGRIQKNS